jgi:hypothetical protein
MNVHLRTLASNINHPLACTPILRAQKDWLSRISHTHIYENVIGHWFSNPDDIDESVLTIWNWKSGMVLVVRTFYYFHVQI